MEWAWITESLPLPLLFANSSNSWEVLCSTLLFWPGNLSFTWSNSECMIAWLGVLFTGQEQFYPFSLGLMILKRYRSILVIVPVHLDSKSWLLLTTWERNFIKMYNLSGWTVTQWFRPIPQIGGFCFCLHVAFCFKSWATEREGLHFFPTLMFSPKPLPLPLTLLWSIPKPSRCPPPPPPHPPHCQTYSAASVSWITTLT